MPDIQMRFHQDMLVLSGRQDAVLARQGVDVERDREGIRLQVLDMLREYRREAVDRVREQPGVGSERSYPVESAAEDAVAVDSEECFHGPYFLSEIFINIYIIPLYGTFVTPLIVTFFRHAGILYGAPVFKLMSQLNAQNLNNYMI